MNSENRKYEIAFLLKTDKPAAISQLLVRAGFAILGETVLNLNKIQLAYPIKKENFAYFGCFCFEGRPAAIKEIRSEMKLNPDILRYLLVTPPLNRRRMAQKMMDERMSAAKSLSREPLLTNEALEKKIEEILK